MWDGQNGPIDPENVHKGFLMDLALIKVSKCTNIKFYIESAAGCSFNTFSSGIPQQADSSRFWICLYLVCSECIQGIHCICRHAGTALNPSFAFFLLIQRQVRFLLSDDTRFGLEQFNYNIFYEHIVDYLEEDVVKSEVAKIIKWWDE
jgi:hypothetical protein